MKKTLNNKKITNQKIEQNKTAMASNRTIQIITQKLLVYIA